MPFGKLGLSHDCLSCSMNKNEKYILQCADCEVKYKKSIKWLENTHEFVCECGCILDVDELLNDIDLNNDKEVYVVYQR